MTDTHAVIITGPSASRKGENAVRKRDSGEAGVSGFFFFAISLEYCPFTQQAGQPSLRNAGFHTHDPQLGHRMTLRSETALIPVVPVLFSGSVTPCRKEGSVLPVAVPVVDWGIA
jgi:hypothetical protein